MALLLNDPCDNFSNWAVTGSPTIVAGLNGNGFSLPAASGIDIRYNLASGAQTDTLTVGFNVKFSGMSGALQTFCALNSDTNATVHETLKIDSSVNVAVYRGTSASLLDLQVMPITVNTWFQFEWSVKMHDTAGTLVERFNGTTKTNLTGLDTKSGGTKTVFDTVQFINLGAGGGTMVLDDIYVRNDAVFGTGINVKAWSGSAFVNAPVKVYSGSAFVDPVALKTWNGSVWV